MQCRINKYQEALRLVNDVGVSAREKLKSMWFANVEATLNKFSVSVHQHNVPSCQFSIRENL